MGGNLCTLRQSCLSPTPSDEGAVEEDAPLVDSRTRTFFKFSTPPCPNLEHWRPGCFKGPSPECFESKEEEEEERICCHESEEVVQPTLGELLSCSPSEDCSDVNAVNKQALGICSLPRDDGAYEEEVITTPSKSQATPKKNLKKKVSFRLPVDADIHIIACSPIEDSEIVDKDEHVCNLERRPLVILNREERFM